MCPIDFFVLVMQCLTLIRRSRRPSRLEYSDREILTAHPSCSTDPSERACQDQSILTERDLPHRSLALQTPVNDNVKPRVFWTGEIFTEHTFWSTDASERYCQNQSNLAERDLQHIHPALQTQAKEPVKTGVVWQRQTYITNIQLYRLQWKRLSRPDYSDRERLTAQTFCSTDPSERDCQDQSLLTERDLQHRSLALQTPVKDNMKPRVFWEREI